MTTNTTCNRNNENAGFPDITNTTCNRSNQNIGGIPDTQPLNHSASRISRHNKNHVLPKSEWYDTMLTSITCYTCHSVHGGGRMCGWSHTHHPQPCTCPSSHAPPRRASPIRLASGRYAFYWNAVLLKSTFISVRIKK